MKTLYKLLAIVMILGLALTALPLGEVQAANIVNCTEACNQTQIQEAINNAEEGDTISVSGGPYIFSDVLSINKRVALEGIGTPEIKVAGTGYKITMYGAGASISGFKIYSEDNADQQQFIHINANNVSVRNNEIWATFNIGDNEVSRAMVISGGLSGLSITGNNIHNIRQPGYVSGTTTGTVSNNYVHTTKGWVLEGGNLTFTGNTFSGNEGDIAILSGVPAAYYTDILAISAANNNAVVEDQRLSPALLSVAYVDDSAPAGGNGTQAKPLQTITAGINRVVSGGTVLVAAGTYAEAITLNKPDVTVKSTDGAAATIISTPSGSLTTGVTILKNMGTVTFDGFTVNNFSESGIIQGMSQREGTKAIIQNNIVTPAGTYLRNGIQVTGDGSEVKNNTVNGARLTEEWGSTGISVTNGSNILVKDNIVNGGTNGVDAGIAVLNYDVSLVTGVTLEGNIIHDATAAVTIQGGPNASGIQTIVDKVTIKGNNFDESETGIDIAYVNLTGSNVVEKNNFSGNKTYIAIWQEGYAPYNYPGAKVTGSINATKNWYGSITGPDVARFYDDNTTDAFTFLESVYAPWCGDAECTFLNPKTVTTVNELNDAIGSAPDGASVYVTGGTYGQSGAINLNNDNLTIILAANTVIQNSSPCFIINADNTRILAEPGAKCIPTNNSNGIDVAAGITGVTVDGLEITKGTTATGEGIAFAGAVTDVVLVDNFIHDLDSNGISFAAEPAGEVDIHGNLFMNNTGLGINSNGATVTAEYNSWGSADGAAAGDGISAGVDAAPYTHVALSLVSSGAPWANQVVNGSTISYAVKANLVNVSAADFVLTYDPALLSLGDMVVGPDFVGLPTGSGTNAPLVDTSVAGQLHFRGVKLGGTVTGDVTLFTVTFNANASGTSALNFDETTDEFGMPAAGSSVNVYAAALTDGSVKVIDLPTITTSDIRGYYLTGDARDFHVTVSNPVLGGNFAGSIDYVFTLTGAMNSDVTSLVCPSFAGTTNLIPYFIESDGNLTGSMASIMGSIYPGFTGFPMTAGTNYANTCTITFAAAKSYPFTVAMVDMAAEPDLTLATLTESASVFNKPALSATGLTGNHQGLTVDFTLNINNMSAMTDPYLSAPVTFLVNLGLPVGTILKLPDNTSLCTSDGTTCSFPVTLVAGSNAIALKAVLPGTTIAFDVPAALYDSLATPDRLLQSASFTGVSVYDNIATLTGSVSMQGRSTRAGVPMTLTGASGFPYGPYTATSIEQISNNLIFSSLAEGIYTVSTNQPRYLNVAGITVEIKAGKVTLSRLELKGGNAKWSDNSIDILDAVLVGTTFGASGSSYDGDVNFDGKVSIQDLALVGGNYGLTSAVAYGAWVP